MHRVYRVVLRNPEDNTFVCRVDVPDGGETAYGEPVCSLVMGATLTNALVFRHIDWRDFLDVNRLPLSLRTQIQALEIIPVEIVPVSIPKALVN